MTKDHREDIRDAADSHTASLRAILAGIDDETGEEVDVWEGLAAFLLDAEVWAPMGNAYGAGMAPDLDRARVECLLTCGGPTVRVHVDTARETVTYHHSWGRGRRPSEADPATRADEREIELYGDRAAPWLELAAMTVEGYA